MSAGMGEGLGFGLDVLGRVGAYKEEQRLTADINRDRQQQNQLKINAYNTKNRNAENAWRNNKQDSDIKVDQKWQQTMDAISEAQLSARKAAGDAAISQQRALVGMINASSGREQGGRRTGGRAKLLENAAQYAQAGFNAAFSRDKAALFTSKSQNALNAFAQGEHVSYITGRPSPGAPPVLQGMKQGPSFFNTAVGILGDGLNRYQSYQGKKAPDAYNANSSLKIGGVKSYEDYTKGAFQQQPSFTPEPSSMGGAYNTMEVANYQSPVFGGDSTLLQGEMDDYFDTKSTTNWEKGLGISYQDTFGLGGTT